MLEARTPLFHDVHACFKGTHIRTIHLPAAELHKHHKDVGDANQSNYVYVDGKGLAEQNLCWLQNICLLNVWWQ